MRAALAVMEKDLRLAWRDRAGWLTAGSFAAISVLVYSFALDLAAKDVGLATQLGRELRVPMEMSNVAQQRYVEGQNRGLGRLSAGAVAIVQEERAGVEMKPAEG